MESKSIRRMNLMLLESRFGSLAEIERATGGDVTASYLSQVKSGYRAMGDRVARALEERLRLHPAGWMDIPQLPGPSVGEASNVAHIHATRFKLPLISWVSAGAKEEANDPYAPGNAEAWVDFDGPCSSSSFCLRVRGTSMVSPSGEEPTFPDGCIIGIDPRRRPKSFEFAVFRFSDTDEATFKQYVADGPLKMLRPLNPTFPVIALGPDARLVGTVFEKRIIARY